MFSAGIKFKSEFCQVQNPSTAAPAADGSLGTRLNFIKDYSASCNPSHMNSSREEEFIAYVKQVSAS